MGRFFTRHWAWLHVAVFVTVPTFLGLGWWQVERAGAGNARSYGYAVEWPSLAAIVIFLYIRAIRMELRSPDPRTTTELLLAPQTYEPPEELVIDAEDDPELAAYNDYLRTLHTRDLEKRR